MGPKHQACACAQVHNTMSLLHLVRRLSKDTRHCVLVQGLLGPEYLATLRYSSLKLSQPTQGEVTKNSRMKGT
jgi:hypothetical protein